MPMWAKTATMTAFAGGLLFAAAQPAGAFCGSLCTPAGVEAYTLFAADGLISGGSVTIGGTAAAGMEVGAGATAAGSIFGVSVTGGAAALAGGLSVLAGGLPDWMWEPDAGTIATLGVTGSGNGSMFGPVSGYTAGWHTSDSSGTRYVYVDADFTNRPNPQGYTGWLMRVVSPPSGTAATLASAAAACPVGTSGFAGCTGGWGSTSTKTLTNGANMTLIGSSTVAAGCTGQVDPVGALCRGNQTVIQLIPRISSTAQVSEFSQYALSGFLSAPTSISGSLSQTLWCVRPNGTTYTVAHTQSFTGLDVSSQVSMASSMCDSGDLAYDVATSVTTSTGSLTVTDPVTFEPGWELIPEPQRFDIVNPGSTSTITFPEPTDLIPSPDPIIVTDPVTDPSPSPDESCSLAWGNVLDGSIVFRAVGCAIAWAFVPPDGYLQSQIQAATSGWSASRIGQLVGGAASVPLSLATLGNNGGGCTGPTFSIPLGSMTQDVQPLNACDPPMSTVAFWVRTVSTIVMVIGGAVFIGYPILRALGMPQIRRGGDSDGD